MPRLNVITDETLFKSDLAQYQKLAGEYNYKYDVCGKCAKALNLRILAEKTGISPAWAADKSGENVLRKDGQPYWDDHPEYAGTEYKCEQCGKELGDDDDQDPAAPVRVIMPR